MKNLATKLIPGILFSLLIAIASIGAYTYRIYIKASPGFNASIENRTYSESEKNEIIESLLKLTQIAEIIGANKLHALFSGSAGAMIGEHSDSASILSAKYHFNKAIEAANQVRLKNNDYHPMLETYFTYGLFLTDIGEKEAAIVVFKSAIEIARKNDPNNYWIKNLENALRLTETKS